MRKELWSAIASLKVSEPKILMFKIIGFKVFKEMGQLRERYSRRKDDEGTVKITHNGD